MLALTILLGIAAAFSVALFTAQVMQVKRLTRRLKKLNDEGRTQLLTMDLPSKPNEELVYQLNRLLRAKERQAQKSRARKRRLQQSIANISHDMRTPLTAILGYVRLLDEGGIPEQEQARYTQIVEARARALNRLVEDFYDLSRLDEDEYQLNNAWIDVNAICLELLAVAYDDFVGMGIKVEIDLISKAPKVFADRNAVCRVFENILGNVRKHGKDILLVSGKVADRSLILSFENGSDALPQHGLERVFERSYALKDSRTHANTGLGLSICKALLNKMGHGIEASYHKHRFAVRINFNLQSRENIDEEG
jgi:signal transduction histidine kinase